MRQKHVFITAAALLLAGMGYIAYLYIVSPTGLYSPAPHPTKKSLAPAKLENRLTARATIPVKDLREQLNALLGGTLSMSGEIEENCTPTEDRGLVCVSSYYEIQIATGLAEYGSQLGSAVYLNLPLDIAGVVSALVRENNELAPQMAPVQSSLQAFLKIDLNLGPDWCPAPRVSANFRWPESFASDDPLASSIIRLVNNQLDQKLQSFQPVVAEMLPCSKLKEQLARIWQPHKLPLKPRIFLQPRGLQYEDITLQATELSIGLHLLAQSQAQKLPVQALPEPRQTPDAASGLQLPMIVEHEYEPLEDLLESRFSSRRMDIRTKYGTYDIATGENLHFIRSGKALYMALPISYSNTETLFGGDGTVHIRMKAEIQSHSGQLVIQHTGFSDGTDEQIAYVLRHLLKDEFPIRLETSLLDKTRNNRELFRKELATDTLRIRTPLPSVSLNGVYFGPSHIQISGQLQTTAASMH